VHLATIPTLDGGQPATAADFIYAFSPQQATAPQPEGTWQFIKWLATNSDAQAALLDGGIIPALHSAQQTPTLTGDADAGLMLKALQVAHTPQDAVWEPEVASELDMDVQKALNGQVTPQKALADASAHAVQTIQQAVTLGE
jgi:ABC-type glycerol-3-phosphate transport system substrate-binding protein